jgi:hypothetical protein
MTRTVAACTVAISTGQRRTYCVPRGRLAIAACTEDNMPRDGSGFQVKPTPGGILALMVVPSGGPMTTVIAETPAARAQLAICTSRVLPRSSTRARGVPSRG